MAVGFVDSSLSRILPSHFGIPDACPKKFHVSASALRVISHGVMITQYILYRRRRVGIHVVSSRCEPFGFGLL